MSRPILTYSLVAGGIYFCCMAIAHFFSFKYPILFVYYDVPFYAYQDKIISFAVIAYACLFFSAARIFASVPAALVAIWVTVAGLCAVNLSQALHEVVAERSTAAYWIQTALIAGYAIWLSVLFWRARSEAEG
jgi:hypothetical protein